MSLGGEIVALELRIGEQAGSYTSIGGRVSPDTSRRLVYRGPEREIILLRQRLIWLQRRSPMPTECTATTMLFAPVERRCVAADFDCGATTSNAGALLLGASERAIGLVDRFAAYFADARLPGLVEHRGDARGAAGVRDRARLRGFERSRPPAPRPGDGNSRRQLAARCSDCVPLAGKSTLNRLELGRPAPTATLDRS